MSLPQFERSHVSDLEDTYLTGTESLDVAAASDGRPRLQFGCWFSIVDREDDEARKVAAQHVKPACQVHAVLHPDDQDSRAGSCRALGHRMRSIRCWANRAGSCAARRSANCSLVADLGRN